MLCDLGADVIKVEPPDGDLTRFATPKVNGLATYFIQQNAGKRNISIDLATEAGADLARRLADRCDVVIENYRAGVMTKLGLDHADARRPATHDLSTRRCPATEQPGRGATAAPTPRSSNAEAGITRMQSEARGGDYATDPYSHADVYTALEVTVAILAALYERHHTGRGRWIDVSMAQTMLYVNEHLQDQFYDGDVDPNWIRSFGTDGYLVFEVASGEQMAVSGNPAERGTFEMFAAALGRHDLLDDPRFTSVAGRLEHLDEIRRAFLAAARDIPDGEKFEHALSAHGLAVGTVQIGASARRVAVGRRTRSDRDGERPRRR